MSCSPSSFVDLTVFPSENPVQRAYDGSGSDYLARPHPALSCIAPKRATADGDRAG